MSLHNEGFCSRWIAIIGSFVLFCAIAGILLYQSYPATPKQPAADVSKLTAMAKAHLAANFLKIPLSFEANQGQVNDQVKYLSHGQGYTLFLTPTELVFTFATTNKNKQTNVEVLRAGFVGANQHPTITADNKLITKTNYFIGNDPKKWRTNIPNFAKINYQNLYSGIDATFYGNQERLEYDIRVAPHADPKVFRLNFTGAKKLELNQQGDLILTTAAGKTVSMHKPVIYQTLATGQHNIDGSFVLLNNNQVGFKLGNYDQNQPLVIDPMLYYSTYLGGTNTNVANSVAINNIGNAYITGYTTSTDFPVSRSAYQRTLAADSQNAFVTKFSATGLSIVYSTYLGGTKGSFMPSAMDAGQSIAINSLDNATITGYTTSLDFPINLIHTYNPVFGGGRQNAFVTELSSDGGTLVYSTYLGGSDTDQGNGIAIDGIDNVYVTGYTQSVTFPVTSTAYQGVYNTSHQQYAFISRIDPTLNGTDSLIYSSFLGGNNSENALDNGNAIAIDSANNAYITGSTNSTDFPAKNAYQSTKTGTQNAFVAKFDTYASGDSSLVYSTYLGGNQVDSGNGIFISNTSNAFVTGSTNSTNFPTANHPYQSSLSGTQNAFITELAATGSSLVYSTYLGGNQYDSGNSIALDSTNKTYVIGTTNSTNFPTTSDALQPSIAGTGVQNTFITKIDPTLSGSSGLIYSTYLGGIGGDSFGTGITLDGLGNYYISGYTSSTAFPTSSVNSYANLLTGTSPNAFVARFSSLYPPSWQWSKYTLSNSTRQQVDIFDVMPTNTNLLWTIGRNPSLTGGNIYLSTNAITPSWSSCTQGAFNQTIGRFGIDRYDSTAYIPSGADVQVMSYNKDCSTATLMNTGPHDDAVAFLQTAANNSYYVKANGTGTGSDNIMVGNLSLKMWNWTATIPATHPANFRINYIDGNDAAKKVFVATNNGLYSCNDTAYPVCDNSSWIKNPNLPADANFSRVFYERLPAANNSTTFQQEKDILVVGGDGSNTNSSGVYVSLDNGTTWSNRTNVPVGNIVSGIDADAAYLYVSAYSFAAPNDATAQAAMANTYSVNNLKQSDCRHLQSLLNGLTSGGVSMLKVYNYGTGTNSLNVMPMANYSGASTFFNSNAVLGVHALVNSSTNLADALYVPALGQVSGQTCNKGGVAIYTPDNTNLKAIAIVPTNKTIRVGDTKIFTVMGIYGDQMMRNLTGPAILTSSNQTVASFGFTNAVTANAVGNTTIAATVGSFSTATNLYVMEPPLQSIAISPTNPTIHKNTTQTFTATGNFFGGQTRDISSTATWASSDATIANMTGNVATANATNSGTTTISATYSGVSNTTVLTVSPEAIQSLAVTPTDVTMRPASTQQFNATANYADFSQDVTKTANWSSNNTAAATVNTTGVATGIADGSANISATFSGQSGSANLTVSSVVVTVSPASAMLLLDPRQPPPTQQFTASATSGGSTIDVTNTSKWASSNPSVADFRDPGTPGLATGLDRGQVTVTAEYNGISGNATLAVIAIPQQSAKNKK